ncbi:hypothetical protein F5887DRAFT_1218631 [Amanita rubescens]|nr:hypothetical protein F5887DRAFT_1218631 [Amanita rubescens]
MSGKTISTSTLSLRFMQNAHRAKSMKEVELEKAAVHDDAQWDVGHEVREAWGLLSVQDTSQNITYETSYLPFIFSDTAEDTNPKVPAVPMGRRKFTNGVEDDPTEKQEPEESPSQEPQQAEKPVRSRVHPHPIPIRSVSGKLLSGLQPLKPKAPKESRSAREAIFDNSGVGTDIRSIPSSKRNADGADERPFTGFLKPLGVDAPSSSKSKIVETADGSSKKHKRRRQGSEEAEESKKKSKKKQQVT